jgi:glycosyltransferase involved in cell wall biosynthesis
MLSMGNLRRPPEWPILQRMTLRSDPPSPATRPLRILYAAGPGDVIATYRHWKDRVEDPSEIVPTYSGQFYELCERGGHSAFVISSHGRQESVRDGRFHIVHRPKPSGIGGVRYHWVQLCWALRLTWNALRFRANVAIISYGACHWIGLILLPLFRVRVVPCLHNALYPPGRKLALGQRLELRSAAWFFRFGAWAVLSCSRVVSRQLDAITRGRHGVVEEFLPVYQREYFVDMPPPSAERRPFRVLYVGRVEADKGVFIVLELARRFAAAGRTDIEFDVCGSGSALEELRKRVEALGVTERVRAHGHCGREMLRAMYGAAHAVIVPTPATEGFNQVVTEAVLSGRPVVTSEACPAVEYLPGAVVLVPVEDTDAYERAVLRLCDDSKYYEVGRSNCAAVSEQFYDAANGWRTAVNCLLSQFDSAKSPSPSAEMILPAACGKRPCDVA